MVRCEEFYKYFEKKGNFCGKSEVVVKKVEEYIDYVKRNKVGGYKISNCALDPFISIEFVRDGRVHDAALKELKALMKKGKILPEKITRRMSIELINTTNNIASSVVGFISGNPVATNTTHLPASVLLWGITVCNLNTAVQVGFDGYLYFGEEDWF